MRATAAYREPSISLEILANYVRHDTYRSRGKIRKDRSLAEERAEDVAAFKRGTNRGRWKNATPATRRTDRAAAFRPMPRIGQGSRELRIPVAGKTWQHGIEPRRGELLDQFAAAMREILGFNASNPDAGITQEGIQRSLTSRSPIGRAGKQGCGRACRCRVGRRT